MGPWDPMGSPMVFPGDDIDRTVSQEICHRIPWDHFCSMESQSHVDTHGMSHKTCDGKSNEIGWIFPWTYPWKVLCVIPWISREVPL